VRESATTGRGPMTQGCASAAASATLPVRSARREGGHPGWPAGTIIRVTRKPSPQPAKQCSDQAHLPPPTFLPRLSHGSRFPHAASQRPVSGNREKNTRRGGWVG
jgi:hypothetical protein